MQLQRMWEGFENLGCIRNFLLTQSRALFPSLLKMRIDEWGPNGFDDAQIGNLNSSLCLDGTGVPVVKKETVGRKDKNDGQRAHTREVKPGCVFTQTRWDKEGYPIRDPDSTTCTGAIEKAEEFGKRLYVEAWKRDWSRAQKKVVMGDGAGGIWNLAEQHFPGALQIVDLYHAREHLWALACWLHPNDSGAQKAWMKAHQKRFPDKGQIGKLVASLRSIPSTNSEVPDKLHTEASYFERNAPRMRYPYFRSQHLFIGSGVIEAGCKSVSGSRLKQSGMFWTLRSANSIIALRCCHFNRPGQVIVAVQWSSTGCRQTSEGPDKTQSPSLVQVVVSPACNLLSDAEVRGLGLLL